MGLFDFLKKNKTIENPKIDITKKPRNDLRISNEFFTVHPDITELIWIKNGPKQNYIPTSPKKEIYKSNGFTISFSLMNEEEPSAIDLNKSIKNPKREIERPPYYPTYESLTPEQRYKYWTFLADPYNPSTDPGYLFLVYYGLERHLLEGNTDLAVDFIVKLREVHQNKSFQSYSGNAITLSCIKNKRPDLMKKFLDSLDNEHEYYFSDSLLLLAFYSFGEPLTAKDIIRLSKSFGYTKTNYTKGYPELFEKILSERIRSDYGKEAIFLLNLLPEISQLKTNRLRLFANMSLTDKEIDFPDLLSDLKFKKKMETLLNLTHEQLKSDLIELRKNNIAPVIKSSSRPKKTLYFDFEEEKRLFIELDNTIKDPVSRHFTYISIQDFYYKYRDLNSRYLNECMAYCFKDLDTLTELQEAYVKQRVKEILQLSNLYEKRELKKEIEVIKKDKFQGRISAFNRLAIIYEKKKEYEKAIEISIRAKNYYQEIGDEVNFNDFNKRIDRLEKKISPS